MNVLLAAAWLGVFRPAAKLEPSDTRAIVGRAGEVVVLTPSDRSPAPTGEVVIVQPLVGMNLVGTIVNGKIELPLFAIDRREGADAVLLLPAATVVRFVTPTAADEKAIKAVLIRDDVLAGVKRSLVGLEVGAIDIDGDGKADFAVTYGCNAWGDGQCQSHGAFLLERTGSVWAELL
ncbi:MAG TPA: hypothetical protein VFQ65_28620 [Kofleriaceae bacterium]|nr:hypothetical protein [Kofleriaceae bacterium]